ncbi:MAG: transmembrane 220 family protein [Pirellulaceae bacterium]
MTRIVHLIFGALFLLSAGLQWNDTDPHVWAPYYTLAGVGAILAGLTKNLRFIQWMCLGASLILMLDTAPGLVQNLTNNDGFDLSRMSPERPYVEESREFGGALIVGTWSVFALVAAIRRKDNHSSSSGGIPNSSNQ